MRRMVAMATVFLCLASCKTAPLDPYFRAELAVDDGRLLSALALLDLVPPANSQYAEARTLAQAVERRMRASQEMLLRGLLLRTEWRDEEAIRYFEWAQEIWPSIAGAESLIEATRNRMGALDQVGTETVGSGSVANTIPVGIAGLDPDDGNGTETVTLPAVPGLESMNDPQGDPSRFPEDTLGAQLAETERLLARGELQEALAGLEDLHLLHPEASQVRRTLARVLHQRALVRYGQGYLEAAIADWARVRQLDDKLTRVDQFLDAARAELSERKR